MSHRNRAIDSAFYVTVIGKGLGGLVELVAGILAAIVSTQTLERIAEPLTRLGVHELESITSGTKLFVVAYFCLRGFARLLLAICLLQERLWAYPVVLLFLGGTIGYQIWLMLVGHYSLGLLGLTLFDGLIVYLTYFEYRKLRTGGHLAPLHL